VVTSPASPDYYYYANDLKVEEEEEEEEELGTDDGGIATSIVSASRAIFKAIST